jgi:glycolate oxidase
MAYRAVDRGVVSELEGILGKSAVFADPENLEKYSSDETTEVSFRPGVVVKPGKTADVVAVMRYAWENRIPVTPRSGGTGVVGGALPSCGGILLSLERMNRIREVDEENLMCVVEPGVITGDLARRVAESRLFYPPDPASIDSSCIGGNVAVSAGGPSAVKYGTTKDYVTGLEVVFPDGSMAKMGGKVVKNATGYDLIGLMVGSEGTLGIITEVTLRLLPLPPHSVDLLIPFGDLTGAATAVSEIIKERIVPATIEFIEAEALRVVREFLKKEIPFVDAGAQLLVRLDGETKNHIETDLERLWEVVRRMGIEDIVVAESSTTQDRLWEARRVIRDAVQWKSPVKNGEDVVVPRSRIPDFVVRAKGALDEVGLASIFFGHAGDGNIHVEILKGALTDEEWETRLAEARRRVYGIARELGGLLSGEHGIGYIRKEYLDTFIDDAGLRVMKRIKEAIDPRGILNPEKIFI